MQKFGAMGSFRTTQEESDFFWKGFDDLFHLLDVPDVDRKTDQLEIVRFHFPKDAFIAVLDGEFPDGNRKLAVRGDLEEAGCRMNVFRIDADQKDFHFSHPVLLYHLQGRFACFFYSGIYYPKPGKNIGNKNEMFPKLPL
jgi:hypothetical protein